MIKEHYKKELVINHKAGELTIGMKNKEVGHVQEWVNLMFYMNQVGVKLVMDDDFGPATEKGVKAAQRYYGLPVTGVVDGVTMRQMTSPMARAFTTHIAASSPRQAILMACELHVRENPRELKQNEGPWVRAYCGGKDGSAYAWCVGSAQAMYDQGLSVFGKKFTDYMPKTLSCDKVGNDAIKRGTLIRNKDLRKMSPAELKKAVKPGDLFLINKTEFDWIHTGIIHQIHGHDLDTYEGNTNDEGSRDGYEWCERTRFLKKQNIDIVTFNF